MGEEPEGKLATATAEMTEFAAKYYHDLKKKAVPDKLACKLVQDVHLCLWQEFVKRSMYDDLFGGFQRD